jgi:hypothetical protein
MGIVGLVGYVKLICWSSTSPFTAFIVFPDFSSGSIFDFKSIISKMELTAIFTFVRSADLLVDCETPTALMVIAKNTCKILNQF